MTWRADYAKEAYAEGALAFRDGKGENPHAWGSFEHAAWNRGYETERDLAPLIALTRLIEGAA